MTAKVSEQSSLERSHRRCPARRSLCGQFAGRFRKARPARLPPYPLSLQHHRKKRPTSFEDPFGNLLAQSGRLAEANLYRFSSKEHHPVSGLVYYLYRFYDPGLQRWVNRDPSEEHGGFNLHRFAENQPITRIDELGLATREQIEELREQIELIQKMRDLANKMIQNLHDGKCTCWGVSSIMAAACNAFRDFGHDCGSFAESMCLLITDRVSYQKCKNRNEKACSIAKTVMGIANKAAEAQGN
jgi:RHS repeat-associated protein